MGIMEIRSKFKKEIASSKRIGIEEVADYKKEILNTIDSLWKNGFANDNSNDMLSLFAGYQVNTGDYECSVNRTLGMNVISMSKQSVKRFGDYLEEQFVI